MPGAGEREKEAAGELGKRLFLDEVLESGMYLKAVLRACGPR